MDDRLKWADTCRWIARALSVIVILSAIPFLLFVGLELLSGEPGMPTITLYLLFLAILLVGLVVAWKQEVVGGGIALVATLAIFGQSLAFRGLASLMGSPLLGPLSLVMALVAPGYSPDRSAQAGAIQVVAWILVIAPIALFLASWRLRRAPQAAPDKGAAVSH